MRHVGVIIVKELKEVSRRKRTYFLRASMPVITLIFLFPWIFSISSEQDSLMMPFIGRYSFLVISYIMLCFGFALTPAYCAPLIASEREQQTLEVLLSTPLRHYEIVLGKAVSRILLLFLSAFSVLPAMFVCLMFGGISMLDVVMAFLIIICNILICAGISMVAGSTEQKATSAIARSYTFIILIGIILSVFINLLFFILPIPSFILRFIFLNMNPFAMMSYFLGSGTFLPMYGIFIGIAGDVAFFVFCIFLSSWILRRTAYREKKKSNLKSFFLVSRKRRKPTERAADIDPGRLRLNPVYWRECLESFMCRRSSRVRSTCFAFLAFFAIYFITLAFLPQIWLDVTSRFRIDRDIFHMPFIMGEFTAIFLSGMSLSSHSFVKERISKTLEALVLTPLDDFTLWFGKFLGVCRKNAVAFLIAFTHLGFCVLHRIYPLRALVMTVVTTSVLYFFLVVTGTGFSIRRLKRTSAFTATLVVASVPFIWIPAFSGMMMSTGPGYRGDEAANVLSLSPWYWLAYPFMESEFTGGLRNFGIGYFLFIAIYAVAAVILAAAFSNRVRSSLKLE